MRFRRVLLVNPPAHQFYGSLRPPAGIAYLSQTLLVNKIECDVLDMLLGKTFRDLQKKIDCFQPDLLGISMFSFGYKHTYELMAKIKQGNPNLPILVGGSHASLVREKVLEECQEIDFGMTMEGEQTILEFCQGQDLQQIKGLLYRQDGQVIYTGDRPFMLDLDTVPFPRYQGFELARYTDEKPIVSSRGCPNKCTYCAAARNMGRKFRMRSATNVVDEIEFWYAQGYRQFQFLDDSFSFERKRAYEVCDQIEKRRLTGLFLRATNGLRADRVDRPLLARMKEIGMTHIAIGVEAGNNKVLRNIKKGETIEVLDKAIASACDVGFDVNLTFLVGSPGETWDDVMDSTRLALKYPVFRAEFYNLIPYPGTELFSFLQEKGYLHRNPEEYLNSTSNSSLEPIFGTPELSVADRRRALRYCRKVESKVLFNTAMRKFAKMRVPGLLAHLMAAVFSTRFVNEQLFTNLALRRLAEKLRFWGRSRKAW